MSDERIRAALQTRAAQVQRLAQGIAQREPQFRPFRLEIRRRDPLQDEPVIGRTQRPDRPRFQFVQPHAPEVERPPRVAEAGGIALELMLEHF